MPTVIARPSPLGAVRCENDVVAEVEAVANAEELRTPGEQRVSANERLAYCRLATIQPAEMTMGQRVTGRGSSGSTSMSGSRGSRVSTDRDPLTHDFVFFSDIVETYGTA